MKTLIMQLPTSYINIDEDEMEYVDGGGTLSLKISVSTLKFAINRSGWAAGSFLGALAGTYLIGPFGTKIGGTIGGILGGLIGSAIGNFIANKVVNKAVTIKYSNILVPFNYSLSI